MEHIKKQDLIDYLIRIGDVEDNGFEKIQPIKMRHGSCCCCNDCGQYHDDCVCGHNGWIDVITGFLNDDCSK